MKTTIDLPDSLLHRAKITAARRHTTLKGLIIAGLEKELHSPHSPNSQSSSSPSEEEFFETDVYGIPVIKSRGVTVTEAIIEKMREEEGI